MAQLVLMQGGETKAFPLEELETVLGRLPECHIQIDSNMVSRKHARVLKDGPVFFIEDLGSGNGTTVNGQKIAGRTSLKDADRIKLGPVLFRFESGGGPAARKTLDIPSTSPPMSDVTIESSGSPTIMGSMDSSLWFTGVEVQPAAKLQAVLKISRSLAGTVDLEQLLPKILESLFAIFPGADRGCILMLDGASGQMVPKATKHRRAGDDETVKLSRSILNKVMQEKTGILSADAANDSRFQASESIANFSIRSMLCVPMLSLDGDVVGIINMDTQNPLQQFKTDDLDLLTAVAGQAALAYETARLFDMALEKKKQDGEMEIAADVQRALLPSKLPEAPGYEIFASYESAQAVGGDYYDCIPLKDGKICLTFGDVAGKGVPASLVMSRMSSVVQNTLEFVQEAGEAVDRINRHMCANAVEGRFVTFTLSILDTVNHEFTLVIAGHMSPMIRKVDGSVEEFPEEIVGLPIGVLEGIPFDVVKRKLEPGETVVIYTDGVSEAMNPQSDLYGLDRLREMITAGPSSPTLLGQKIVADVKRHANGRPQNDDITLMCFGRLP